MRKPPLIGPSAVATPAIAAQNPMARPRSSGGNVLVMIDKVAGMMNAPPMPMNARVTINWFGVLTSALASEPMPKIVNPSCSAPRRPKRSPKLPAVSSKPANTSVYESTIHWSWLLLASRSRTSVGMATFRIELSTMMIEQREAQDPEGPPALVERFARAVERQQGGGSGRGGAHGRDLTG